MVIYPPSYKRRGKELKMGVETSVGSSITTSISSISSTPSFGGEIGSFSFANTVPLSAPSEISLGGNFSNASFLDCSPIKTDVPSVFETDLSDINLDPDLPNYEIPQVFRDAFSDQELLDPPLFSEQINILDIPIEASESPIVEQINYSTEPQPEAGHPLDETEAKMIEIFGEPLTVQTPVILSEVEDRAWESTHDYAQDPRNDSYEVKTIDEVTAEELIENVPEEIVLPKVNESIIQEITTEVTDQKIEQVVPGPALQEAVKELEILTEMPAVLPEEIIEPMVIPETTLINAQIYPEIMQATTTYKSLMTAGITEIQAEGLVQSALVSAGTELKIAQQILTQVKTGTKIKNSHAEFSSASNKILKQVQNDKKDVSVEDDEKKKKLEFKFVVDLKALANIYEALKKAVTLAPVKAEMGKDIIDSNDVGALMPTEVENPGIKSGILPIYVLEWFNYGDGAYREAVAGIKNLGLRSRQSILEKGFEIHRNLPPVTIAEMGEEVEQADVDRVLTHRLPDLVWQG